MSFHDFLTLVLFINLCTGSFSCHVDNVSCVCSLTSTITFAINLTNSVLVLRFGINTKFRHIWNGLNETFTSWLKSIRVNKMSVKRCKYSWLFCDGWNYSAFIIWTKFAIVFVLPCIYSNIKQTYTNYGAIT